MTGFLATKKAPSEPGTMRGMSGRIASRASRFIRVRSTALGKNFLLTTIVNRLSPEECGRNKKEKRFPFTLLPMRKTRLTSRRSERRWARDNIKPVLAGYSKSFSSFSSSIRKDISTSRSFAPLSKAMATLALQFFWLIRSFHIISKSIGSVSGEAHCVKSAKLYTTYTQDGFYKPFRSAILRNAV